MARYTDAKCRLCRREGVKLFLKGDRCFSSKCPIEKKGALPPGQHGRKGAPRQSEYGQQLREKQKIKRMYGILEQKLRNYFQKAAKARGETGTELLRLLETRLDNVVYRSGLSRSRSIARQLIHQGHISIDGKRVNVSSCQVKANQVINLRQKAAKIGKEKAKEGKEKKEILPGWLEKKAVVVKVTRLPGKDELPTDINTNLIAEFYSR